MFAAKIRVRHRRQRARASNSSVAFTHLAICRSLRRERCLLLAVEGFEGLLLGDVLQGQLADAFRDANPIPPRPEQPTKAPPVPPAMSPTIPGNTRPRIPGGIEAARAATEAQEIRENERRRREAAASAAPTNPYVQQPGETATDYQQRIANQIAADQGL